MVMDMVSRGVGIGRPGAVSHVRGFGGEVSSAVRVNTSQVEVSLSPTPTHYTSVFPYQ
jgi:hypothetical protein